MSSCSFLVFWIGLTVQILILEPTNISYLDLMDFIFSQISHYLWRINSSKLIWWLCFSILKHQWLKLTWGGAPIKFKKRSNWIESCENLAISTHQLLSFHLNFSLSTRNQAFIFELITILGLLNMINDMDISEFYNKWMDKLIKGSLLIQFISG